MVFPNFFSLENKEQARKKGAEEFFYINLLFARTKFVHQYVKKILFSFKND